MSPILFRLSLLGLAISVPSMASAQTQIPGTPYTRIQGASTYTELTNPTVLINQGSGLSVEVPLPFTVRFYDQDYNSIVAGNSGCVSFQTAAAITTSNQAPGTTSSFQNIDGWIAPFWDSLTMQSAQGAHLAYEIQGIAPNRSIIFEWRMANRSFAVNGTEWFNFQLRVYEGLAGRIEIDYGPQGPTPGQFVSATMGMEDINSMRPILLSSTNCTTNCILTDYTNLVGQRITLVQDPGIELIPLGIRTPMFATLGVEIPVTVLVANLHGTALGPFNVQLSASPDETGQNAVPLGDLTLSLGAYQTNEIAVPMTGPLTLGEASYHLVLDVDSDAAVAEVDEQNNRLISSDRVRFLPSRADFDVVRVDVDTTMVTAGGTVMVDAQIRNSGSQPISGGEVAIMMSTNTAISPQDVELVRFPVNLAAGETTDINTSVTIPAATNTGTYWLGALADPGNAIEEVSEANNGRAALTELAVAGGNLAILTMQLPRAVVGQTYVAILIAAGGDEPVVWEVQGSLPAGIGLVGQTGEFFGRAQTEGVYSFTIEATSGAQVDSQQLTLTVTDPEEPLTIVTRSLPSGVVGQEYEFALRATGGSVTSSLAWSATGLPTGISLSPEGVLAGSAIAVGVSTLEVTVTNGAETSMRTLELSITENANLQIVPAELPVGTFGVPYSTMIAATGGVPPVSFIVELGELPNGLDLMPDGTLSGTPMEVGTFRLVIEARDSGPGGVAAIDVNTFELSILDAAGFEIQTAVLPEAVVNTGYNATVKATGGLPPYDWSLSAGRLPMGLIARVDDNGDFLIVGNAAEPGVTNLLIEVVDSQGRTARRAFALVVVETPTITTPDEGDGCGCTAAETESGALLLLGLLGVAAALRLRKR